MKYDLKEGGIEFSNSLNLPPGSYVCDSVFEGDWAAGKTYLQEPTLIIPLSRLETRLPDIRNWMESEKYKAALEKFGGGRDAARMGAE